MGNRVITISREFGSGGRTVGKKLAERLGIPCYDQEIIMQIAEQSGLSKEYIKEWGEHSASSHWLSGLMAGRDYYGHSVQDDLWQLQSTLIKELAEKSSCVIIGRCADYILRDKADCLTVFIHANMEFRQNRIISVYGESKEAPEKRLRDKDKRRRTYYQLYTDTEWGKMQNYHVALDSGKLGIDTCVDILASLY